MVGPKRSPSRILALELVGRAVGRAPPAVAAWQAAAEQGHGRHGGDDDGDKNENIGGHDFTLVCFGR